MKKLLTLTNEQARLLYNLIINHTVPERSDNRKRIRFLEVLEDAVDEFSDEMRKFVGKKPNDVKEKIDKLSKRFDELLSPSINPDFPRNFLQKSKIVVV